MVQVGRPLPALAHCMVGCNIGVESVERVADHGLGSKRRCKQGGAQGCAHQGLAGTHPNVCHNLECNWRAASWSNA